MLGVDVWVVPGCTLKMLHLDRRSGVPGSEGSSSGRASLCAESDAQRCILKTVVSRCKEPMEL